MGRIVAFSKWDELTLGTNCRFLEFGMNCRLGRIVAWDELSPNPGTTLEQVTHNSQKIPFDFCILLVFEYHSF